MPQDYSMNNHALNNGGPQDMSRTAIPPGTIIAASPHPPASTAPGGYQVRLKTGIDTISRNGHFCLCPHHFLSFLCLYSLHRELCNTLKAKDSYRGSHTHLVYLRIPRNSLRNTFLAFNNSTLWLAGFSNG